MSRDDQAWIELPSEEAIRESMEPGHPYDFGFVAGMSRLVRAHEEIGRAYGPLFQQIMFAPGALSRAEREMVAAVATAAQDCHY